MSNIKKQPKAKEGAPMVVVGKDDEAEDVGQAKGADGLTPRQAAFVEALVNGATSGNATKSAIAAGYSENSAAQIGATLTKLPHVSAAVDAALRAAIGTTLTVQAVAVIRQIVNDPDAPLKLRGDMAAKVIEYSGLVERTKAQKAKDTGLGGGKTLAECSRTELEEIVRKGAAVLQAAASLPPAGPVIEGVSAQDNAQRPALAAE